MARSPTAFRAREAETAVRDVVARVSVAYAIVGSAVFVAVALAVLGSMIDEVCPEGDHTCLLVLAPHPTLGFRFVGGEEGAWRRAHPTGKLPFWLTGRYRVLLELD